MTAVMRAVSQQAGAKILRIGVVQGGKVIDERLIKLRTHVTIGPSEKSMFVVASRKVPANFRLFELIGTEYHLNYLEGMTGRVALKTGVSELSALGAQAKLVQEKGATFQRVRLTDDSRGKVVVGEMTFLFQFVTAPPVQPKPQLPMSVKQGIAGDIDWFTTIVAAFSFLIHFFVVALIYSDWMDPIVRDEDAVVSQLVESVRTLPPPPVIEKQKSDAVTDKSAAVATNDTASKVPAAQQHTGNVAKNAGGEKSTSGEKAAGERVAADAKAAELSSALAELDVQTLGALGTGGVAVDNVLGNGEVPAGMLDEAARSGSGAGAGDSGGLKGFGGSGKGGTGALGGGAGGTGDLSTKGERGSSEPGGATGEGKKAEVKGPTGDASVGGAGVNGGAVANAGSVVARMKGRFRACYQAGLNSNPDMAGSVTLMATIGPNGEVQSVGGGGGSLGAIMGCLKGVVSGAAFSPPEGGKAFVSIPITFVKQ